MRFINELVVQIDLIRNPPEQRILVAYVITNFIVDCSRLDNARVFGTTWTEIMFRAVHHDGINDADAVFNVQTINHANAVDNTDAIHNMNRAIYDIQTIDDIQAIHNVQAIHDTDAIHKVYAVDHPDAIDKAHTVADYNRVADNLF